MKDLDATLQHLLNQQLTSRGYEVALVPLPSSGDRSLRMRTLEEVLDEYESDEKGSHQGYLIQVRQKSIPSVETIQPAPLKEQIYLPDGKPNTGFLLKNAELLFHNGEHVLALNIYRALLKSGEKSAHCLYWIGRCCEIQGHLSEAQSNYEESIAFHPQVETYQRLAALLIRAQKDQEAAESLERALLIKDTERATKVDLLKMAGNCWLRAKQTASAERCYLRAIEIDPAADDILVNLGALRLAAARIPESRQSFEQALSLNPKNAQAIAGLGSAALAENDRRNAHDHFAQSLDLNIQNPTALYHLIKCAFELKTYATAARIVEEYAQCSPINANLLYSLAGLQFHLGRIRDAESTCARIFSMQPGHSGATELLKTIDRLAGC